MSCIYGVPVKLDEISNCVLLHCKWMCNTPPWRRVGDWG